MPNWSHDEVPIAEFEINEQRGRFQIEITPSGIRGTRPIGGPLRRIFPFTTRSRPSFHIRVERLDFKTDSFSVGLARRYVRTKESEQEFLTQKAVGAFEDDFKDGHIS